MIEESGIVRSRPSDGRDWIILAIEALVWGWLIEGLSRLALPGFGLALGGPELQTVPLAASSLWALLWFVVGLLPEPRWSVVVGTIGAIALAWLAGAGPIALLVGPFAALAFYGVRLAAARVAVPERGGHRLRLLITLVLFGIVAMVVNIVLNFALVLPMVLFGFVAPHMGLALGTGLAACVNAALLLRGLLAREVFAPGAGWLSLLARYLVANVVLGLVLYYLAGPLSWWLTAEWDARVLRLGQCIVAGTAVYFATLWLSGFRPVQLRPAVSE